MASLSPSLSSPSSCHPPSLAAPRSIRCLRNIIHWNLISAFILRNATWFVVQLTMSPEVHQSNVVCPGGTGPGAEGGSGWGCPGGGGARARPCSPQSRIPRGRGSPRPGGLLLPPYSVPHSWLIVTSDGGGWQGWCRLVTAAYNYFHVTNFFWMFGEGCYLHTAIVLTYSTDRLRKWMFICIGWGEQATPCPGQPSSSHPDSGQLAGGLRPRPG